MINFTEVREYLRNTPYKFHTTRKGFTLSSSIIFNTKFNKNLNFNELLKIFRVLINDFDYQFVFALINPNSTFNSRIIKFKFDDLENFKWDNEELIILFQPTKKLKPESIVIYKPSDVLFHITNKNNLDIILKDGLKPFGRNKGPTGYNYPPMVHFLINLNCMVSLEDGDLKGVGNWKEDLIMFKVDPKGHNFFLDPACDVGAISYESISPKDIKLVNRVEYPELFKKYSIKDYKLFQNYSWYADI